MLCRLCSEKKVLFQPPLESSFDLIKLCCVFIGPAKFKTMRNEYCSIVRGPWNESGSQIVNLENLGKSSTWILGDIP